MNSKAMSKRSLFSTRFVRGISCCSIGAALLFTTAFNAGAFENAADAMKSAREKLKASDFVGASKDADEAARLAGANIAQRADALFFKAQVAEGEKDYAKALAAVEAVLAEPELSPNHAFGAIVRKANLLGKEGKNEEAAKVFLDAAAHPKLQAPAEKSRVLSQFAEFHERNKEPEKAVEIYGQILADAQTPVLSKVHALRNRAKVRVSQFKFDEAQADYQEALRIPELKTRDRAIVLGDVARAFSAQGDSEKALETYAKILEVEGLTDEDKKVVSERTRGFYKNIGDAKRMKSLLEALGGAKTAREFAWLRDYAQVAEASGLLIEAVDIWGQALALPELPPKNYTEAALGKMTSLASLGRREELAKFASEVAENAALDEESRFSASLIKASFSSGKPSVLAAGALPKSSLDAEKKAKAFDVAGKLLMRVGDFENARFLGHQAEAMFQKRPEVVYECRFVDQAPSGVTGWFGSSIFKDPGSRESRFEPYNQAAAANLINDVNVTRSVVSDGKAGTGNAAFYMAGDARGWHIFIDYKDDQIEQAMAGLVGGGNLEMYFTPGKGECYYQFMIDVPGGKTTFIPWTSPHRNYRKLDDYLQTQIAPVKDGLGVSLFIPWEVVYDKLPKEGELWPFGLINFARQGGFTWGSGQTHEMSRFGKVRFVGIEKALPAIRRAIVMKAFANYKESVRGARRFWNDEVKGDRAFFNNVLVPEIAKLDELGKRVTPDMSKEDVELLFAQAVPNWMEFNYLVAELRTQFLNDRLFSQAN